MCLTICMNLSENSKDIVCAHDFDHLGERLKKFYNCLLENTMTVHRVSEKKNIYSYYWL